jgi:hypothetical protein
MTRAELITRLSMSLDWNRRPEESKYIRMAIDLLKEQTTKPEIEGDARSTWWYVCEECHTAIDRCDKYCRQCGRFILWQ